MSNKEELRIGLIGAGLMGSDHAERLSTAASGAQLVAVSDPDTARAEAVADSYVGVRTIGDARELVSSDDVDAVVIASPGSVHEEQVLACIEHGKPVLCEKPLTMDAESSLRLVRAERESGKRLVQLGFMRRFDPEYARQRALISSGRLGRTLLLHNTHRNRHAPDSFRSEMIVRDSLVHEVDVSRFLFGEEIEEITVLAPTATSAAPEGVVDPQVAMFRMAGGGLVINEVFVRNQVGYEVRCEAVCEAGSVMTGRAWSDLYVTSAERGMGRWGGEIPSDFRARFARAYDIQMQSWVDACRAGTPGGPSAWDGYAATAVCEAGMTSLATGERTEVQLVDPETLS
jgi:myo-inositol 2-dehydrogenase/D-chiro-inositol 1-dehydrogenase